jgi:hypothetical protein
MYEESNMAPDDVQQELDEYFATHAPLPPLGALATAHEIEHERQMRERWPVADLYEKLLAPYRLSHPRRIVLNTIGDDIRPLAVAHGFAEICKLERIGHCAAYKTDYAWNAEYQMWLPDTRRSLFRRIFMKHYGDWLVQKIEGSDEPIKVGPGLIEAAIAYARGHEGVALSPTDVGVTEPGRWLTTAELSAQPAQRWLVRFGGVPVIPAHGIGCFYGYSESYKSYFAVKLAVALATGQPALGDTLALDCPERSRVLYVAAEDAAGLGARVAEACRQLRCADARLLLYNQPVVITDPMAVLDLVRQAKQLLAAEAPVAAVILDTYNQTLGPGDDENSADTARNYTLGMRLLQVAFKTVVVTVHHPPKSDGDQLRGSGALENNMDFALRFEREDGTMRTRVSGRKTKNGPKFSPFTVAFADSTDGMVLSAIESAVVASRPRDIFTPSERDAFQVLVEEKGPVPLGAWVTLVEERFGHSRQTVKNAREAAEKEHLIALAGKAGWELTAAGREYAGAQGWSPFV